MWEDYKWMNPPQEVHLKDDKLYIQTEGDTDFWRTTHYGFDRMTGHALLKEVKSSSFTVRGTFQMTPKNRYDQCGILLYIDEDTWIKCSLEYIPEGPSHLGSVVTSHGFSDWSTRDFERKRSTESITFEMKVNSDDVLLYAYTNGQKEQLRMAHVHKKNPLLPLYIGPYACSPNLENVGFSATVSEWTLL